MLYKKISRNKAQTSWVLLAWLIVITLLMSAYGSVKSKVYHVSILSGLDAFAPAVDGFKAKMTELGYVECKNIVYDVQKTDVDVTAYQKVLQKLVDEKVDVIVTFPTEASMEAKTITEGTGIPAVFTFALIVGLIAPVITSSSYFYPGNHLDAWQMFADSDLQESPLGCNGRML